MDQAQELIGKISKAKIHLPASDHSLEVGGHIQIEASFRADNIGFQGHFPSRPILPGFLQIQLVLDVLQLCLKDANGIELSAVDSAKFVRPILPEEKIRMEIERVAEKTFHAVIFVAEETASVIKLEVS